MVPLQQEERRAVRGGAVKKVAKKQSKPQKLPDLKVEVRAMLLSAACYIERSSLLALLGTRILPHILASDDSEIGKVYEDARAIAIAYIKKGAEL